MQACDCTTATNIFILVGAIVFGVFCSFVMIRVYLDYRERKKRRVHRQAQAVFNSMWSLITHMKMGTYYDASDTKVSSFCSKYNDNTSHVNLPNPYKKDSDDDF